MEQIVKAYALIAAVLVAALLCSTALASYGTSLTQIRYADAYCESGGNIHAIGWRGLYRGKWQFDRSTWKAYAPSAYRYSDPAYAPESVQDWTALHVPYDAWPNC